MNLKLLWGPSLNIVLVIYISLSACKHLELSWDAIHFGISILLLFKNDVEYIMRDFLIIFDDFFGNNGGIYDLVLNTILKKNFFLTWIGWVVSRVQGKKLVTVRNSDFYKYWKIFRDILLTNVVLSNSEFHKWNFFV